MKQPLTILTLALSLAVFGAAPTVSHAFGPAQGPAMEQAMKHTTNPFKGIEVNGGTVTHTTEKGKNVLKVSADFKLPKSPAPHWQVVDREGNVYLLKQFNIVGEKHNTMVELPRYIRSVAKVQVWCSFAEVLLGEASFAQPIRLK